MMLSPGSFKCLKFCTDVEIQKYKGRGEDRGEEEEGQILHGRKGVLYPLLHSHPVTLHPTATHAAMYAVFLGHRNIFCIL